jgi:predicted small lipoprotein YifL
MPARVRALHDGEQRAEGREYEQTDQERGQRHGARIPVAAVNGGYTARTPSPDFVMSPFSLVRPIVVAALIALLLAGCGNKGPLVKPTPKPAAPPAAAAPQPATH